MSNHQKRIFRIKRALFLKPVMPLLGLVAAVAALSVYGVYAWKNVEPPMISEKTEVEEKAAVSIKNESPPFDAEEPEEKPRSVTLSPGLEPEDDPLNDSMKNPGQSPWEELQKAKTEYEERVVRDVHVEKARVETPSLVQISRPAMDDLPSGGKGSTESVGALYAKADAEVEQGDNSKKDQAEDVDAPSAAVPGYVAFMISPEGMQQGVERVMEDLAREYVQSFPDAPRVTVSLIVGGGVRRQGTFLNDGSGGVKKDNQ